MGQLIIVHPPQILNVLYNKEHFSSLTILYQFA